VKSVPITEVPKLWKDIRPHLEKIIERGGSDGWISEDVYAIICAGNATLYVNDGEWLGFCVVQLLPHYTTKKLHVWILHLESDPEPFMGRLKDLARQHGATRITFSTARKGWEKRAERLGFTPVMTLYTQEV
jgi:hypothetical protein